MDQQSWLRRLPESAILLILGALVAGKAASGALALYIHPRYHTLLLLTGVALVLGGGLRLWRGREPVALRYLLPFGAVLLVLLIVPARPLGASGAANKSLSNNELIARLQSSRSSDTRTWTLLEWSAALRSEGVTALQGKPAQLEGFIFRPADLPPDLLMLGRYLVTCCAADGRSLALAVEVSDQSAWQDDQWARFEGTLEQRSIDGTAVPILRGTLTPISVPAVPYLYP